MVRRFDQSGASLLEGIAYLGIASMVLLGAMSLFQNVMSSYDVNRTQQELSVIQSSVRRLYNRRTDYGVGDMGNPQVITPGLINAGVFPGTLQVNKTTLTVTNRWGGDVIAYGWPGFFSVQYKNVPQDVCIALLASVKPDEWPAVSVVNVGKSTSAFSFAPTVAQAATFCDGTQFEIQWISR